MSKRKETIRKMSYKRKCKLFEEALGTQEERMAKLKGLLGTMIYIFGEEVMTAVTTFSEEPTEDNKDLIRQQLNLRFMELQDEE